MAVSFGGVLDLFLISRLPSKFIFSHQLSSAHALLSFMFVYVRNELVRFGSLFPLERAFYFLI